MSTELETRILDSFNTAFQMDPVTMRLLSINVIPANALLKHPEFPVRQLANTGAYCADGFSAANMVLGIVLDKYIVPKWSEEADEKGSHQMIGFEFIDLVGDNHEQRKESA